MTRSSTLRDLEPSHAIVPADAPLSTSAIESTVRPDGTVVLGWPAAMGSLQPGTAEAVAPLDRVVPNVVDWLPVWAAQRPHAVFMAERDISGHWQPVTWSDAWRLVQRIAMALQHEQ